MSDYSTFNAAAMRALPEAQLTRGTRIAPEMGSGCSMDAPGFPSYFVQHVYTSRGDSPNRGPVAVIEFEGAYRVIETAENWPKEGEMAERMRKLWQPLPLDHERTRLWILTCYSYFKTCYADAERPEYGRPGTLIYPRPGYKREKFRDDARFSDAWREAERARVAEVNRIEDERAAAVAIPENHRAVLAIRKFYPEYQPELDLIANPPSAYGCGSGVGSWWETEAERPTPEKCAPRSIGAHPVNGTSCQWCGWVEAGREAEVSK